MFKKRKEQQVIDKHRIAYTIRQAEQAIDRHGNIWDRKTLRWALSVFKQEMGVK